MSMRRREPCTRTSCVAPASCANASAQPSRTTGTMVDRLRILLNRPLRDGDRRRLFAVAVAVIAAATGLLAVLDDAGPVRNAKPAAARTAAPTETTATAIVASSTPVAPSEESDLPPGLRPSAGDISRSKRAARRFLAGYLPFTYGRGSADRIRSASSQLRAELARSHPRVPASERRRRARLELLQSDG